MPSLEAISPMDYTIIMNLVVVVVVVVVVIIAAVTATDAAAATAVNFVVLFFLHHRFDFMGLNVKDFRIIRIPLQHSIKLKMNTHKTKEMVKCVSS